MTVCSDGIQTYELSGESREQLAHETAVRADLVLFVVDGDIGEVELSALRVVAAEQRPLLLVLNKVDALSGKSELLPTLEKLSKRPFAEFIPVSARTGENLERLVEQIFSHLPVGPKQFPDGMVTDRDLAFRIAETIREKLMTLVHQEVPYGLTVEVEHLGRNEEGQRLVHALIWLERESQKKIVIGKAGSVLKQAGTLARQELRELLGERVHLELWVKVRERWADNERELARLGFEV